MQSEREIDNVIEKCTNGKLSYINCDDLSNQYKNDKMINNEIDNVNAAYLKHQLQLDGIVLTKLQIPKWSSNIMSEQAQNSIMNIFYLGRQPVLGQQQIIGKQMLDKQVLNRNETFDQQKLIGHLNGSSNVPINSVSSIINYNSINNDQSIGSTDSSFSSKCHFNNGYISSDAHSLEYNNEYSDQNPYNSQSPINNENSFEHNDSTKTAVKELFLPIILSGFGNLGAGVILDSASKWLAFREISQLIVLVPALLGLKGNVEMTLSSRLGTCANLGELQDKKKRKSIVIGNVSLAQCQASTVGLLAPFIAISFSYIQFDQTENTPLTMLKTIIILASSVMTSGLADLMLSSFMCFIVILSVTKLKINADNIATPIAASVGDLLTMTLFALLSRSLYTYSLKYNWLPFIPILIWLCIISFTGYVARRNKHTSKLIYTGWATLMIAMMIQNTSGTIMGIYFKRFNKMTAFQPVINGFGGNLVAVQSSRIATYLHKNCNKRQLPASDPHWFVSPLILFGKNRHGKLALVLILMAAPLQIPYVFMIRYITSNSIITPAFLITYYLCCTLQVTLCLYFGYIFVHLLWKWGFNPDNNAIPILTACADLIGSALFAMGFTFLRSIHDPNAFNDGPLDEFSQVIGSTVGAFSPNLNATINGISDLLVNSTLNNSTYLNSFINSTTLVNTLNTTSIITESTTVLNDLTTLINDNFDKIVNGTL